MGLVMSSGSKKHCSHIELLFRSNVASVCHQHS